jgi:hypothetical protein
MKRFARTYSDKDRGFGWESLHCEVHRPAPSRSRTGPSKDKVHKPAPAVHKYVSKLLCQARALVHFCALHFRKGRSWASTDPSLTGSGFRWWLRGLPPGPWERRAREAPTRSEGTSPGLPGCRLRLPALGESFVWTWFRSCRNLCSKQLCAAWHVLRNEHLAKFFLRFLRLLRSALTQTFSQAPHPPKWFAPK